MSRVELPLRDRELWATGDVLLWAEVRLFLKDNAGGWRPTNFLVDSGSEMTTMPAWFAKQRDLPMPRKAAAGAVHRQTGLEIRAGLLRTRIAGLDGTDFTFPCFFLGDPDIAPAGSKGGNVPRNLLGLSGVVDKLRIIFDGSLTPSAVYGKLILETL
jgi:hypothetical protein